MEKHIILGRFIRRCLPPARRYFCLKGRDVLAVAFGKCVAEADAFQHFAKQEALLRLRAIGRDVLDDRKMVLGYLAQ